MPDHRIKAPAGWRNMEDDVLVRTVHNALFAAIERSRKSERVATLLALTPGQRSVYLTTICESEFFNGGLEQFLANPSGEFAPETPEAYRLLGFTGCAQALLAALARVELDPWPRNHKARETALLRLIGDGGYLDDFDILFDESMGGPLAANVGAGPYIRGHPEEFFIP